MESSNPRSVPPAAARLLTALADVEEPLLVVDSNAHIYFANQAARTLLADPDVALPRPLGDVLKDPAMATGITRLIGQPRAETESQADPSFMWELDNITCQVKIQRAGDDYLIWASPLDPHALLQDRLGNEHMRRFWAAALAGIGTWTWDLRDDQLRADAILGQLTGLSGGGTVPVSRLLRKVHPDDQAVLQTAIRNAVNSRLEDEIELDTQFRFRKHDGNEMWLAMRGGVIRGTDGKAIMLSGVHFDVTERKRAEQALRQAKEALQEVSRAKDSFLAKVSHEIRTPLTTMLGYAELLFRRTSREQDRHDLGEILDSGRYLQRLVDDLLDLSRIVAGKVSVSPEPVDLRRMAHELLSAMNMKAAEKSLGFSLNVGPGVPSQTLSDPVRIRQVLTNLIGNAVKFTDTGEVSLRIYSVSDGDGDFIAFEVKDTGPGIPEERLQRLFEPFTQARSSDSQHGGLGLGLTISLRLAEVLGGSLTVSSQRGIGSTFTFRLPAIAIDRAPPLPTSIVEPGETPVDIDTEIEARILVVDDVQPILSLLENYLTTAGAEVVTAGNGLEALEALAEAAPKAPFDLVLMDIHMPHLDGIETLARMRSEGYDVPVVALSASAMKDEQLVCQQRGFDGFIAKPFSAEQVLSAVARLLGQKPQAAAPSKRSLPDETVLIVEDNEALAELTSRQLASLGFRVEMAHSGAAALDRVKVVAPVAMLVDLSLPDMHGADLCRALREDDATANARLIAYTGMEDDQARAQALEAGFDDVLVKPAGLGDFAALLVAQPTADA